MTSSPAAHPWGFFIVVLVTAAMMFDFAIFREQTCIVACPYGRLQSVLLDRDSLIVSYDKRRGEPRGRRRARAAEPADLHLKILSGTDARAAAPEAPGDCVDCGLCVQVCPTGIDIRDGLQLECVNCTQCIDACDSVMDKLKRPRGLVRYSSQNAIEGAPRRLLRPRVLLYPAIILIVASLLVWRLATMQSAYVSLVRDRGMPYNQLPTGELTNQLKVRIVNRSPESRRYRVELVAPAGARIVMAENPITVPKGELLERSIVVELDPALLHAGKAEAVIRVSDGKDMTTDRTCTLVGPAVPRGPVLNPSATPKANP
jgi:cytochrome c oxidase accessory protein FixG